MSRIESALTNAAYATAVGFVATESGIIISNALNNTAESALAEAAHTISEITVLATGAIIGGVTFLGKLKACFCARSPIEAVRLAVNALETQFASHAIVGAGLGSGLAWQVGEIIRVLTTAKEEIVFKVATAITIGSSLLLAFSRVNRVAQQNIALGIFTGEITGILLTNAIPSWLPQATLSGVIGGATTGMLTLARG